MLQSCLTLCDSLDCSPPGTFVHGDSPGKNTRVGRHPLLQGIFLTQGSTLQLLCLLHWQACSLSLVPPGKPLGITIWSSNSTPRYILKTTEGICLYKYFYKNIHNGTIYNTQRMETTRCPSTDEWIIKYDIPIQWDIIQWMKRNKVTDSCYNMGKSWKHYVKWEKTEGKKQKRNIKYIHCIVPSIRSVQNRYICRDKVDLWFQGLERKNGEWLLIGRGFLFWGDENVLAFDSGDGYTIVWIYNIVNVPLLLLLSRVSRVWLCATP